VGSDGAGYLAVVALESPRTLSITANANLYHAGETAIFTATLQGPSGGVGGATVQAHLVRADAVSAVLTFNYLGSGVYRATYLVPDVSGYLQASFTALGSDNGTPFTRQIDKLFAIAPHAAQLAGVYSDRVVDEDGDGFNDALMLVAGQSVAQATEYALVSIGTQTITLRFEGSDIRHARLNGPYTVSNVFLIDLEAGAIPSEIKNNVYVTGAYKWYDFGFDNVYIPVAIRR
jgi:hypothetical protein